MTVSLFRLYLLRAVYVLLALSEGFIQLRLFLHHGHWTEPQGVAHCFLLALAILSIVGVRYPLQMLPLLVHAAVSEGGRPGAPNALRLVRSG